MQLSTIRTQVLNNIGKYQSSDTQFNTLVNQVINLAIDEIKTHTVISNLLSDLTSIPLVSGTNTYSLDSDVDILIRVAIRTSTQEGKLDPVNSNNLLKKISTTLDTGTPKYYRLFGNSSGVPQIRVYPIYNNDPQGASITGEYLPVLAELSSDSDTNIITLKYFNSVIRIATEMAYRAIVDHSKQPLENIITVKRIVEDEAMFIMQREYGAGDYDSSISVSNNLRVRRQARYTQ